MKSEVKKRSIALSGHTTSVSLEDAFWNGLKEIAAERHMTLSELIASIDSGRKQNPNLSSAIRLFVLAHYSRVPVVMGAPQERNMCTTMR